MKTAQVFPLDLQTKRRAIKKSQAEFGELLGVTRHQVQNYEAGRRMIPTDKACEAAMILGGLTLRYKGVDFELKVKQEPSGDGQPSGKSQDVAAVLSALAASKEMRDFVHHTQMLMDYVNAVIRGTEEGRQYVRIAAKEGYEAQFYLSSFLSRVAKEYPDEFAAGIADANAELSGTVSSATTVA